MFSFTDTGNSCLLSCRRQWILSYQVLAPTIYSRYQVLAPHITSLYQVLALLFLHVAISSRHLFLHVIRSSHHLFLHVTISSHHLYLHVTMSLHHLFLHVTRSSHHLFLHVTRSSHHLFFHVTRSSHISFFTSHGWLWREVVNSFTFKIKIFITTHVYQDLNFLITVSLKQLCRPLGCVTFFILWSKIVSLRVTMPPTPHPTPHTHTHLFCMNVEYERGIRVYFFIVLTI